MAIDDGARAELLELYKNATGNLSELRKYSVSILLSCTAIVTFIFIYEDKFLFLNKFLLIAILFLAGVVGTVLYCRVIPPKISGVLE